MKEITIKIQFDDEGGYKGHGENTAELIKEGVERYLEIDLEGDGVIKKEWKVEIINNPIYMKNKTKYKFFYNGIFSNWFPSNFTVNGRMYNCGEQYMMYQKAILFKDFKTSLLILLEESPNKQKELGKKVKNFNQDVWDKAKYELVKKGLREKFNQNKDMKEYLLSCKGQIIVEASHEDRIWGIGFDEEDALPNIKDWGQNLLGKILTELSNEL